MLTDKTDLSERDICTKFILSAMERAGWDKQTQLFEEFPLRVGHVVDAVAYPMRGISCHQRRLLPVMASGTGKNRLPSATVCASASPPGASFPPSSPPP